MRQIDTQFVFSTLDRLAKNYPFVSRSLLQELSEIWGGVEADIMVQMHDIVLSEIGTIHIDLKPELATLQAQMQMYVEAKIIKDDLPPGSSLSLV